MAKEKPKKAIKVNPHFIITKKLVCQWKAESPGKSNRVLAEEATKHFGRKVHFLWVSKVLEKKEKI